MVNEQVVAGPSVRIGLRRPLRGMHGTNCFRLATGPDPCGVWAKVACRKQRRKKKKN